MELLIVASNRANLKKTSLDKNLLDTNTHRFTTKDITIHAFEMTPLNILKMTTEELEHMIWFFNKLLICINFHTTSQFHLIFRAKNFYLNMYFNWFSCASSSELYV